MTRAGDTAYRIRHGLLAGAVFAWLAGVWFFFYGFYPDYFTEQLGFYGVLGTPVMLPFLFELKTAGVWVQPVVWLGIMLLTQWLLLMPGRGVGKRLMNTTPLRGWRRRLTVTAAAFMAMILSLAALATALEVPDAWTWVYDELWPNWTLLWLIMLAVWAAWGVVLWCYSRHRDEWTWLSRVTRALLAGSVAETMVATAVHAFVYDRDDCYCARGSYTGMVLGGSVLLWALGPAVVLLYLRERRRREALLQNICVNCGYDLRGTLDAGRTQCPECGAEHQSTHRKS